ncbi:CDC45-like protein [Capsaspora owczarzaki ATCC 30864]|uniref:CDC45-like protein n=1 Tax=Capsaspora owczarzaki (strain ATCC 30864) TaxID=595528 RepID=A0A0D2VFJ0_CAPO3|nr:CDC45-like protein [Capsaspora owczarzaki ATCC 30864]KJE88507.1 CDC45-like protein [Capsaspora owczarzaki ATCC 30864]|eukprot:XP_004365026.2 CDC45-like protein [Capsaspora owczarzaki ATCC 30864]
MLIANFRDAYEQVKRDALQSGMSVTIFVAQDVDALAACCILTSLLQADMIGYQQIGVNGSSEIAMRSETDLDDEDRPKKSIFLINCGAFVNIAKFMVEEHATSTFYVVDSHRPMHLHNIYSSEWIQVFDDGDMGRIPRPDEVFDMTEYNEDEDADELDEDEEFALARQQRRENPNAPIPLTRRERHARQRSIRDNYYSKTFFGTSVAIQMFMLAESLNKESTELLWWAIVGLTDQFVHERIDSAKYAAEINQLNDAAMRLGTYDEEQSDAQADEGLTEKLAIDRMQLRFDVDFRFLLYRHWSLYESMVHSSHVGARLQVWTSKGKQKLNTMLATMGLPLSQCKQKVSVVDQAFRSRLLEQVESHAANYQLPDVRFATFTMRHGYRPEISASDAVYAATAILESSNAREENFHRAIDSLRKPRLESTSMLSCGVDASRQFHQALARLLTVIIETGMVTAGPIRHVTLSDSADLRHFWHPASLTKLAIHLTEALRHQAMNTRGSFVNKPLLIAVCNSDADMYSVLGLTLGDTSGEIQKNHLGTSFREILKADQMLRCRNDSFDSNFVEIKREDYPNFLENLLHLHLR